MAKFPKEVLQELAGYGDWDGYELIKDKIVENTRWSILHEMIFEAPDGKFYKTRYSVGATEYQDESPFEYDPAEIECQEVHQVEKLVKVWENV